MIEKPATHYSWWFRQPVDVRDWPVLITKEGQLFVDDHMIAERVNVERQFHQAKACESNPVMLPEHPWEGLTLLAHGTVIREPSGRLRMYYCGYTGEMPFDNYKENTMGTFCVAYSDDGLHWEKPKLGINAYMGRDDTNLILPNIPGVSYYDQISVLYDEKDPDPARRWKMGAKYCGANQMVENPEDPRCYKLGRPPYEGAGYFAYFSTDGLHWNRHPEPIMTDGFDVELQSWPLPGVAENQSIMYDRVRNKFVAFMRIADCRSGITERVRARAISESEDFIHWSTPRVLFLPLEDDEPGLQFYSSNGFNYESMYLGLLRCYRSGTTHQVYFQLVSSRDGVHWERAANRQPFIPNEPLGTFGGGYHSDFSNPPIRMGDELWFYYGSSQFGKNVRPNIGGICLSKLRVDGFASIEGGCVTGTLTTRPLDFTGGKLTVNLIPRKANRVGVEGFLYKGIFVNTKVTAEGAEGCVAVEVLDRHNNPIPGFGAEDCIPATIDSVAASVCWKDHADLSALQGQTIRLKFHITNAGLYSFAIK